jgi:hypothetical protein
MFDLSEKPFNLQISQPYTTTDRVNPVSERVSSQLKPAEGLRSASRFTGIVLPSAGSRQSKVLGHNQAARTGFTASQPSLLRYIDIY